MKITSLQPGTVTLVGGGPGDPGLVTVAGLHAVQQADVLLIDHLAPAELVHEVPHGCEVIDVAKLPRGEFVPQEHINQLLVEHARAGQRVVRLKGGDPFVFGRGSEEWEACAAAGVPVRVIPGISSSIAAGELAGIPVTHRGLSQGFSVVSGHVPPGDPRSAVDWSALARSGTTIVVLMGVKNLPAIADALLSAGLDPATGAAVVADACRPDMDVIRSTLGEVAEAARQVRPPAVTIIGAVAGWEPLARTPGVPHTTS